MKRLLRLVLPALLLAVAAGGGWWWWSELRFQESTDNAYVRAHLATVGPEVEGRVVAVEIRDNQLVRAGDVLFRIDDRDYRAQLAEASADLQAKEAELRVIAADRMVQEATIRAARASVGRARAQQERAARDLARYNELVERKNASRQQADTAVADAAATEADVAAAEASLAAAEAQIQVLDARERSAGAALAMAQATLDLAQIDLDRTVVKAPLTGVIGARNVQVGDHVKPGLQTMRLIPLDGLYVEANFKETQIEGMRIGGKVMLEVDAFPDMPITGTIESFAPASGSTFSLLPPENATGNFTKIVQRVPVRIAVPADSELAPLLRPGLSVEVTADRRDMPETGSLALGGGEKVPPADDTHLAGR